MRKRGSKHDMRDPTNISETLIMVNFEDTTASRGSQSRSPSGATLTYRLFRQALTTGNSTAYTRYFSGYLQAPSFKLAPPVDHRAPSVLAWQAAAASSIEPPMPDATWVMDGE
eukprot:649472-Pleurochrysis_carterae.AAC.1